MGDGAFDDGFVWGFEGVGDGVGLEELFVLLVEFVFLGAEGGGVEADFSGISLICEE